MAAITNRLDLTIVGVAALTPARATALPTRRRARPTALLVTSGTELHMVSLAAAPTRRVRRLAGGFTAPAGVALDAPGRTAYVIDLDEVTTTYAVHAVTLGRHVVSKLIHQGAGAPGQVAVRGGTLVFVDGSTGELRTLDLMTLAEQTLGSGLGTVGGVSVDSLGRIHLVETDTGRWLSIADGEMGFTEHATGLNGPRYLTNEGHARTFLVTGADPGNGHATLDVLQATTSAVNRVADLEPGTTPMAAWVLHPTRLVAVDPTGITWWDPTIPAVPALPVSLTMATTKPFIGSYQRVVVDLGTSGFAMEDLDFRVTDGPDAGEFSLSRDDLSAANEVMLLVGYQPGQHKIEVQHTPTNTLVAELEFTTTDEWNDTDATPSHWCTGPVGDFQTGYTWGGGPSTPQNVDVQPQSGPRGVAILMVDVSDARYPTGAVYNTIRDNWRESLVGASNSAGRYYSEVSRATFSLALQGSDIPLVNLAGNWASTFSMMPSPWPTNGFAPTNAQAFAQACVSNAAAQRDGANNPILDFAQVRSLILVVRSAGPAGTDNFFWPQAWGGNFTIPGGSVNLAVLGMPDDWEGIRSSRTRTVTLAHELGHNLGYPDLYTNVASWNYSADIVSRDVTSLDLMSSEAELPDMTIAQRMESGWVRPEWVQTFDFSSSTVPVSQTVTLFAIEAGAPPPGQLSGVEIRIADGWNYYFEYRLSQAGQIGDQLLGSSADSGNGVVVGTDVLSQNFSFPINRPQIIRLRPDIEGERSFFAAGQNYKERDTSSMAVADFTMTVLSTNGNTASVKIEYGTNGRPDLSIRPWPGGNNWQSPDITVSNARSLADPARWANVPWEGHANTVTARYRNRGPVTCRNVQVDFFIKDFTVGGAPEVFLGSDVHDVPPDSSVPFVEFSTQWNPSNQGHRCIIARTPLYLDTSVNPNIVELTDTNNMAQTNYTRYISASASPARRVRTWVSLHNPWPQRALMYVMPQISGPFASFYRLYLEHQALRLDPGETRRVEVMAESKYGDPRFGKELDRFAEKLFRVPTNATLTGYGIPPEAPLHPQLLGGAQLAIDSARGTRFEKLEVHTDVFVRGQVVDVATGAGVPGVVLLTFHSEKETERNTVPVTLGQDGWFAAEIKPWVDKLQSKELSLHYPGTYGHGPCDPDKDRYPLA